MGKRGLWQVRDHGQHRQQPLLGYSEAIREAKSDHSKDGEVEYRESQPFAVNNQNWEIDTTDNGTVVVVVSISVSVLGTTPAANYVTVSMPRAAIEQRGRTSRRGVKHTLRPPFAVGERLLTSATSVKTLRE
jgi:hypothetical protein